MSEPQPMKLYLVSVAAYQKGDDLLHPDKTLTIAHHYPLLVAALDMQMLALEVKTLVLDQWTVADGYYGHSAHIKPLKKTFIPHHFELAEQGVITFDHDPTEVGKMFRFSDDSVMTDADIIDGDGLN